MKFSRDHAVELFVVGGTPTALAACSALGAGACQSANSQVAARYTPSTGGQELAR